MQDVTKHIISKDPETTEAIAAQIGQKLRGGETVVLVSDLGGGKTTFVRGLARGAGSSDKVASPTFTISKVYDAGRFAIHHFDFYRLQEAGVIASELAEVVGDPKAVVVTEWADVVQEVLPTERLTITITQTRDGDRELTLQAAAPLAYLLEGLE